MIEIKNLSFCYRGAEEASLGGIDLSVKKGELVVLTGESGCGKTTLTRILNGLCPQFYEGDLQGRYLLDGRNAFEMSLDDLGLLVGNVFQDPRSQFFTTDTTDEIMMAMENRNYSRELMEERLAEMRGLLQLDDLLGRNIFHLSSGEKQKIAIGAACAVHPDVVVLDEPSANLDAAGTRQLAEFLQTLKARGLTVIISEHRLNYLGLLLDRMVVMKQGQILSEYTAQEARKISPKEMIRMGLRLFELPAEEKHPKFLEEAPHFVAQDISFKRQKRAVLRDVSLPLPAGKIIAIAGPNGAGKTTFCKIATGLLKENGGKIFWQGKSIRRTRRIKNSFFVGQDADYQLYAATVLDEVTLNMKSSEELTAQAKAILQELNLWEFAGRHPVSLSGGQKQRVLLAAALLRNRPLLVLDEPTSGLDGKHMRIIADILRQIAAQGTAVLLVTHDQEFSQLVADEVVCLENSPAVMVG